MSEWIAYTGTNEQIEEMRNAEHGFVLKSHKCAGIFHGDDFYSSSHLFGYLEYTEPTHYLIANPHPLADMIERWARTGQPVYWKNKASGKWGECAEKGNWLFRPFYAPDICDYSFSPFEEKKKCYSSQLINL